MVESSKMMYQLFGLQLYFFDKGGRREEQSFASDQVMNLTGGHTSSLQ